MTTYAEILLYGIPFFIVLIIVEWYFSLRQNQTVYRVFDTISSLSSGMSNSLKDVLGLSVLIISYEYLVDSFSIATFDAEVIHYMIAFVVLDFAGYWSHRLEHKVNILWNRHIIHHSSEEFNLACALRQNVSAIFALFTIFLIPAAILGVPAKVIAIVAPIHLFAQFWYHTKLINRMGFLEHIIVTPSHHRVHHAINEDYLDKNFGQIFIVWDKMFGTFEEEDLNNAPVYGIKKQPLTWNPFLINFMHLKQILVDAWHTQSWSDKLKIWFMPTGWRPDDVEKSRPIYYTIHHSDQIKYANEATSISKYAITSLFVVYLSCMMYFFATIDTYSLLGILMMGGYFLSAIFAYTSLMDGDRLSYVGWSMSILFLVALVLFAPSGSVYFVGFVTTLTMASIALNYYLLSRKHIQKGALPFSTAKV